METDTFWDEYEVDCDDGTSGDVIYVLHTENAPIV